MMRALLVTFIYGLLATSPVAQAALWDCICWPWKKDCAEKRLPPGVHRNAWSNILDAQIGTKVTLTLRKGSVKGTLVSADFEGVLMKLTEGGKSVRKHVPHKKIEKLTVDDPTPVGDTGLFESSAHERLVRYRLEARKKYLEFLNTDFIAPQRDALTAEIRKLRELPNKAAREAYLREQADAIMARVKKKHGTANIGFHYNLNGGVGRDYVDAGGLRISRGDIALQYGHGDPAEKVYYFQSSKTNLFDVIDASSPKQLVGGRMGSELNIFNLDHDYFKIAHREGGIPKSSDISADFNPDWIARREFNAGTGRVGVPYQTYLAPPIPVFQHLGKHFGDLGSLSRHDETLLTMRQVEAILLAQESFLPSLLLGY